MDGEEERENHVSFWVVRVPEAVFSTDPQDSLRVSNNMIPIPIVLHTIEGVKNEVRF